MRPLRLVLAPPSPRAPRLPRARAALAAAAVVLAACAPGDITATAGAPGIGIGVGEGSGVSQPSALVGRWANVRYYRDGAGALHSSETRWEFLASGWATRTIVTTNITYGLQDVIVREGRWSATAGELVVDFEPAGAARVRVRWTIDRAVVPPVLWLDDTPFQRVA